MCKVSDEAINLKPNSTTIIITYVAEAMSRLLRALAVSPEDWSLQMGVIGTELSLSQRKTSALNLWSIYPVPNQDCLSMWKTTSGLFFFFSSHMPLMYLTLHSPLTFFFVRDISPRSYHLLWSSLRYLPSSLNRSTDKLI